MHIVVVYTEAEMHILHIIQLILLFPFVCEPVGEVEWKRGPELPHLTLYIEIYYMGRRPRFKRKSLLFPIFKCQLCLCSKSSG